MLLLLFMVAAIVVDWWVLEPAVVVVWQIVGCLYGGDNLLLKKSWTSPTSLAVKVFTWEVSAPAISSCTTDNSTIIPTVAIIYPPQLLLLTEYLMWFSSNHALWSSLINPTSRKSFFHWLLSMTHPNTWCFVKVARELSLKHLYYLASCSCYRMFAWIPHFVISIDMLY